MQEKGYDGYEWKDLRKFAGKDEDYREPKLRHVHG